MNGFQPLCEFFILLGRRKGKIAIRKVNGAEVGHIFQMLCRDVFIIALLAVVIGVILSWQIGMYGYLLISRIFSSSVLSFI
jgi:predicted lysophospholipase L1 biosynthesis ABC-type transport system permease subunit